MSASRLLVIGSLAITAVLSACASDPTQGYAFNSSYDQVVRTVDVNIFQNPTFYRGVEVELGDALIKQVQATTPWLVTRGGDAQTTLTGTITDIHLQSLSTSTETGYVQELDYVMTVEFTWKDNKSGKTLVSRRNFTAADTFTPARPVGERIERGQHGAVQRLAQGIVSELRSNW